MTETQALLTAYIEAKAKEVIRVKEEKGVLPVIATSREILSTILPDTIECMRMLCKTGIFKGCRTLNYPALMRKV